MFMTDSNSSHTLILFTQNDDLRTAAGQALPVLKLEVVNLGAPEAIGETRLGNRPETPGEKLSGRLGTVIERITKVQPVLIIFDCDNTAVPWHHWIPVLKSSPATRRLPVLAIGQNKDQLAEARRVGSDDTAVLTNFLADASTLIGKNARIPDYNALAQTCAESLPSMAVEGLELFNQGEFYKCHDALEEAWVQDKTPGRNLYRAVLQVGIAYFQIERGNYRGAAKMLLRVRQWLDPLPDVCRGIDVADLRQNAEAVQAALIQLGPEHIADFDRSLFKPVRYQRPE